MTKLSSGTLILGVFAVLFGLVGAYAVKQYLPTQEVAAAPEPEPEVRRMIVPLASIDLPAGRTIAFGDIAAVRMTAEQASERGFPHGYMTRADQVIGRTLRQAVTKGQPFYTDTLYPEGTGPSVAERLKPGHRAVTVPLMNSNAELALISPGAVVDIVFRTFADEEAYLPETTVTLLEHVEVLAIGRQTFPGGQSPVVSRNSRRETASVTLAVSPEQASALKVVEGRGSMSLVLRGPEDGQLVGRSRPQTLTSLLDLPEPDPPFATQIYRRGRLTTQIWEDGRRTVIADSFGALPVAAADTNTTPMVPVSHSVATTARQTTAGHDHDAESGVPCGCGGK